MTTEARRTRVLVVEDSAVQRELQVHLLNSDPQLEVVGTARDGREAIEQVRRCMPDVVTMDFHMPHLDGAEATRIIMESQPVPIVVISGSSARHDMAGTFRALDAGALVIIEKPYLADSEAARKMVETVKLMAEIKVVRRWPAAQMAKAPPARAVPSPTSTMSLVAIGASTGGPLVLQTLLASLPRDFPVPVLIVQHISPGFTEGFAEWLSTASGFPVCMATQGAHLAPGRAYVAPDGLHMEVKADGRGGYGIALIGDALENGHRPSVSRLFSSVAEVVGDKAVGVILTGMGKDGAAELGLLRRKGGITIAQSRESSVVAGMPGEAIRLDAAAHILAPAEIGGLLMVLVKRRNGSNSSCNPPEQ